MLKKVQEANKILKVNMQALWDRYPEIAARLENVPLGRDFEISATGKKRYVNVYCRKGGFYYYDYENPLEDVEKQLQELNLKNAKIAVFLGFGLGYEVDYFARNMAEKLGTQRIIIVERDMELFKTALAMFNYVPMMYDKNIKLLVGVEEDKLFTTIEKILHEPNNIFYIKAMKPVYHLSSFRLHREYYMKVISALKESTLYVLSFYGNSPHDSLIGVENMLANVNEIVRNPGINLLYDKFKDRPAVVVATGPSLNKNKHLLKGLENRALIIAADASLRILLDMGIKPHIVTSLEREEETVGLLEGFTEKEVENVYLAACPVVQPRMYEVYPGPRIIVYRNFDHFRWLNVERGILPIKHSAGNMAFKVAEALGCNPIILIGQDLAYSRDGKTHAAGTLYGDEQSYFVDADKFYVMGNDGQPILTNRTWNEFRLGYEVDIAEYKGICINSTEGGAYIKGTVCMPFSQAIEKYINEDFYPLQIIRESLASFTADNIEEDLRKVRARIEEAREHLEQMMEYAREAFNLLRSKEAELAEVLEGEGETGLFAREDLAEVYRKVMERKMQIFSLQPTMQLFLMHIIQSYHIKFHIDINEMPDYYEGEKLVAAQLLYHIKWFAVMHDIIGICIERLDNAHKNLFC